MVFWRFVLVGDPVSASRSPEIHRTLLQEVGLEGEYTARACDADGVVETISELRAGELAGVNVTMPYKGLAADLADSLLGAASLSGSVNTLNMTDGRLEGQSTDSMTVEGLALSGLFRNTTAILVLGSGGSARAALAALTDSRPIYLAARNVQARHELVSRFGVAAVEWGTGVAGALVVNATPLGMASESLPPAVIEVAGGLIDLPYGPTVTPAVAASERLGIPHVDGHEFLLRQAVASFNTWTGHNVEFERIANLF